MIRDVVAESLRADRLAGIKALYRSAPSAFATAAGLALPAMASAVGFDEIKRRE